MKETDRLESHLKSISRMAQEAIHTIATACTHAASVVGDDCKYQRADRAIWDLREEIDRHYPAPPIAESQLCPGEDQREGGPSQEQARQMIVEEMRRDPLGRNAHFTGVEREAAQRVVARQNAEFQKLCIELDAEKTRCRLFDTLAKFLSDDNLRLQSKVKHLRIAVDRLASRAEDADAIVQRLRTMSIAEMMCENLNVKHHVEEWEARCLNAEAELLEMARDIVGGECGSKPTEEPARYVVRWVRESTVALARKHLKTQ